ncbi:uncharacterized protein LOC117235207, partial [Bombus vosnesenskii]|uniref:Uncharacterized protein LOC117235207 n=1 Tax=Bombus vosnesenskii TaxID=207650 RepID=A0A6J3KIF2_9HYME
CEEERNVDDDIPCIRHLLHWNSSPAEGKGNTHEILTHRLRQINRNDLADWLGKSSFVQIGKDLDRALVNTFDELVKEETELPKLKQQEGEDEEYKVQRERRKKKYTTERSNVATDYIHLDSDSDTDAD